MSRWQTKCLSTTLREVPPDYTVAKNKLTKLIIWVEHLRVLHTEPTFLAASLAWRFHILGTRQAICAITRSCVTCQYVTRKTCPQLLGQLSPRRVNPGFVFEQVGVDYARLVLTKSGYTHKPTRGKTYVCIFDSFTVIRRLREALPDVLTDTPTISLIWHWRLCQKLVKDFWQCWSSEYLLCQLKKFTKWTMPTPNVKVGAVVCVRNQHLAPTRWLLACVIQVHPGKDGLTRVVTIHT